MPVGRKSSFSISPNTLSTPSPNPGPVGLSFANNDIGSLPNNSGEEFLPYHEGSEQHTLLHSPSVQSYVTWDDLSMTPDTTMGHEMQFGFNSSIDVELSPNQSGLGSDVHPGFQGPDMGPENLCWHRQGNTISCGVKSRQSHFHPNNFLNYPFIPLGPTKDDIPGAEIHIINPTMGRRFNPDSKLQL
ncbi:hypothetical protein BDV36DRAFT_298210 [Aspergillus pseudocaelatus]|uniref:Uncharacterized protein n=1 Tax=Aspergillus pseudocaelatus TaxID=1825620 RepID=A0ABQ6WDK5_9EURO|nr:hypothetical protein BDV36DRAFT_298210 [Aspergillus pseudocaelatus]